MPKVNNPRPKRNYRPQFINGGGPTRSSIVNPRKYSPSIRHTQTFTFLATTTALNTITTKDLLSLLFVTQEGSSNIYSLITAVCLKSVCLYGPSAGPSSCFIEFFNSTTGNIAACPKGMFAATNSSAQPWFLREKPLKNSAASEWQNVNATNSNTTGINFRFQCPEDTYVEIKLSFMLNNGQPSFAVAVPGSPTYASGMIYCNALDSSVGNILPVSYNSPFV